MIKYKFKNSWLLKQKWVKLNPNKLPRKNSLVRIKIEDLDKKTQGEYDYGIFQDISSSGIYANCFWWAYKMTENKKKTNICIIADSENKNGDNISEIEVLYKAPPVYTYRYLLDRMTP